MMDRWGKGTCVPNPEKTANTRETEDKLKKLIAERERLDAMLYVRNDDLTVTKHSSGKTSESK
jgi:hypothetical protein